MVVFEYAVFYELLLPFTQEGIHCPVVAILSFGEILMGVSGTRVVVEQTMNFTDFLNIIADHLHHYIVSVF